MLQVEAVIKMFDPTYNLRHITVKCRQPNPRFKRAVYRRAVVCSGRRPEPLTAREIAERVLVVHNIDREVEQAAGADLSGSILVSLRNPKG